MVEQNIFGILDSDYLVDNINPPIWADIEIFLCSISIPTQSNNFMQLKILCN